MINFESDYIQGAHPRILARLAQTNMDKQSGYGFDDYSKRARDKIRQVLACPSAQIYFTNGGTQTNAVAIKSLLKPYEGVLAVDTAHIVRLEAGAIEQGGSKVLTVGDKEGRLDPEVLDQALGYYQKQEDNIHIVRPGLVFISFPTELGTLYSKSQLEEIYQICKSHGLRLYVDGARLGYGLTARGNDLTFQDLARLTDAFYIGGAKLGAIMGEALVFPKGPPYQAYASYLKGEGALLAKSRLQGIQFDEFFTDNLYLTCGRQGNAMADLLRRGLKAKGYKLYCENPTNQVFIILDKAQAQDLGTRISFSCWDDYDKDRVIVRLATSWATSEAEIEGLLAQL